MNIRTTETYQEDLPDSRSWVCLKVTSHKTVLISHETLLMMGALGADMCMRRLRIALYITDWVGDFRYALDHTTHASVANAVRFHNDNKPYWNKIALEAAQRQTTNGPDASSEGLHGEAEASKGNSSKTAAQKRGKRKAKVEEDENVDLKEKLVKKRATLGPSTLINAKGDQD